MKLLEIWNWIFWGLVTLGVLLLTPFLAIVYVIDRARERRDA